MLTYILGITKRGNKGITNWVKFEGLQIGARGITNWGKKDYKPRQKFQMGEGITARCRTILRIFTRKKHP